MESTKVDYDFKILLFHEFLEVLEENDNLVCS